MTSVVFVLALAALAGAGVLFFLLERYAVLLRTLEDRLEQLGVRLKRLEQVDRGGAPYRVRDIAIPDPPRRSAR